MSQEPIRFNDGAAYERGMGIWSRLAGQVFLDWLAPSSGLRWIDVGCGNGAFTELLLERCKPSNVQGIDPSEAQLVFARGRNEASNVEYRHGDAITLPFDTACFDAAVMALVIFFVPDPAKSVSEMARVVRPGGMVTTYAWDMLGGGFPFDPIQVELRALGITPPLPPSVGASRMEALRDLWTSAGLQDVETREITVQRVFTDFDDFWISSTNTGSLRPTLAAMPADDVENIKSRLRVRLPVNAAGRISYDARANAIKGRVPK